MSNNPGKIAFPADLMVSVAAQIREFLDAQYRQHSYYFQTGPDAYVPGCELLTPLAPTQSHATSQALAAWQKHIQDQYSAWYQLADLLETKARDVQAEEQILSS